MLNIKQLLIILVVGIIALVPALGLTAPLSTLAVGLVGAGFLISVIIPKGQRLLANKPSASTAPTAVTEFLSAF